VASEAILLVTHELKQGTGQGLGGCMCRLGCEATGTLWRISSSLSRRPVSCSVCVSTSSHMSSIELCCAVRRKSVRAGWRDAKERCDFAFLTGEYSSSSSAYLIIRQVDLSHQVRYLDVSSFCLYSLSSRASWMKSTRQPTHGNHISAFCRPLQLSLLRI